MQVTGCCGFHFSRTRYSSSKRFPRSKETSFTSPFVLIVRILSSPLKLPKRVPLASAFSLLTVSSNQILLGASVETPSSFISTFFTEYLVTRFPLESLPLIARSEKSISILFFLILGFGFNSTVTVSASPLGLAEKYSTSEPFLSEASG